MGMTGSAAIAGLWAMKRGCMTERYGVTSHGALDRNDLPTAPEIEIGGWEHRDVTLSESLRSYVHVPYRIVECCENVDIPIYRGIVTDLDYPPSDNAFVRRPQDIDQGAAWVHEDIVEFQRSCGVDHVVVVFLGSPSVRPMYDMSKRDLAGGAQDVPSGLIYAMGAALSAADFVDFTPSYTLEFSKLWSFAESNHTRLAGRDGSTGQTMIKVALAELFGRRGLEIEAWYSSNVLGNHDGLVLTSPGYGEAKTADKLDALQLEESSNLVDIRYLPYWGDRKESWDAGELRSWLGSEVSVRINWRGSDSELAAPLVLDIARLLGLSGSESNFGFVPELGFFFKRPFLRESSTLSERWNELVQTFGG
jgi:myo-inositol-1-phosphate synthase